MVLFRVQPGVPFISYQFLITRKPLLLANVASSLFRVFQLEPVPHLIKETRLTHFVVINYILDVVTENPREEKDGCPAVNNGNPVYLPHKTDCRKFYVCDTGVRHLKTCQAGLHFNTKVNACDYPANAGCEKGWTFSNDICIFMCYVNTILP